MPIGTKPPPEIAVDHRRTFRQRPSRWGTLYERSTNLPLRRLPTIPGEAWHWRLARTGVLHHHLQQVEGLVERTAVLELWHRVGSAPPWSGPPLWIHGDLHPGNLLVNKGRLSAVIDFGDLAAGDPATDLSIMWMLLPPPTRPALRASARGEFNPVDDHTLLRARGWALALGLAYLCSSRGDEALRKLGLTLSRQR